MAKIVTVTAHTAIDNIIEIENFTLGAVIRARTNAVFPAGKGVNVARTAAALGKEVVALGFVGEQSAPLFAGLETFLLKIRLLQVPGETRANLTVIDGKGKLITHIQTASDYQVSGHHLAALEQALRQEAEPGDIVVLSGSLPPGVPAATYVRLIGIAQERGARTILDSEGANLRFALNAQPYMIKPNLRELSELLNLPQNIGEHDVIDAARNLASSGISLVVISRGPEGVVVSWDKGTKVLKALIHLQQPDLPRVVIGSGDALVGGFAAGLLEGQTLPELVRLAVACAAANLLSLGPGLVEPDDVALLLPKVEITEIS